jgi:hypothetical protein
MIMPFGKHRGKPLEQVPLSYLRWVLENCDSATPSLREEISRVIRRQQRDTESTTLAIPSLAARWYRQLAGEFHPDRGGSHEGMKAFNRARDLLLEMAGAS